MAAKYIIGKAELLTYSIDAPKKKPNDKAHPYSLSEAKEYLLPQINSANEVFAHLPGDACFDDFAVAKLVLHPSYIAKSYFPEVLLNQAGLSSLGSRTTRIAPRKKVKVKSPDFVETTELLVAGTRRSLRDFVPLIESMTDDLVLSKQFAQIESFQPMTFDDRIKENLSGVQGVYEVGLHFPPDGDIDRMKSAFKSYASSYGFDVKSDFEFRVGHMLFVAVESIGLEFDLQRLALFTLMRVLRPMPKLRSALPLVRSNPLRRLSLSRSRYKKCQELLFRPVPKIRIFLTRFFNCTIDKYSIIRYYYLNHGAEQWNMFQSQLSAPLTSSTHEPTH